MVALVSCYFGRSPAFYEEKMGGETLKFPKGCIITTRIGSNPSAYHQLHIACIASYITRVSTSTSVRPCFEVIIEEGTG